MKVLIENYADGFQIVVDGRRFVFDEEETKQDLVEVFQMIGTKEYDDLLDVEYEEVY